MANKKQIATAIPACDQPLKATPELSVLLRILPPNIEVPPVELDHLFAFLAIKGYLPAKFCTGVTAENFPAARHLTAELDAQLRQSPTFVDNPPLLQTFTQHTTQFMIQALTFYDAPVNFITDYQVDYFSDLYPTFDTLIMNSLNGLNASPKYQVNPNLLLSLYYSLMFLLIDKVPEDTFSNKVYICVDFAQGDLYTQYIRQTLTNFNHIFIQLESKVSVNTDIFLSDFHAQHIRPAQVIWTAPPTPTDWSNLADILLAIRQAKIDRVSHQALHPEANDD